MEKLQSSTAFAEKYKALPESQKLLLDELIKDEIIKENKKSIMEVIIKLMTLFGFGKGKLAKMFPAMKDKINEFYGKQFAMEEEEKKAVTTLTT
jgi:predicted house-cleaning noncanonical NTP pyrophosphatase (MazG superfamily)